MQIKKTVDLYLYIFSLCENLRLCAFICVSMNHRLSYFPVREALISY